MKQTTILWILSAILVLLLGALLFIDADKNPSDTSATTTPNGVSDEKIASYEDCIAAGYPIMESYPSKCAVPGGKTFTQDIGNELDKADLISIKTPRPTALVQSPLVVTGEARGGWYFEASFPIALLDGNGKTLAEVPAQAQGDWMTSNFVPYKATLTFAAPTTATGTLVLKKDNPSGLPENEDELRVPVRFR